MVRFPTAVVISCFRWIQRLRCLIVQFKNAAYPSELQSGGTERPSAAIFPGEGFQTDDDANKKRSSKKDCGSV